MRATSVSAEISISFSRTEVYSTKRAESDLGYQPSVFRWRKGQNGRWNGTKSKIFYWEPLIITFVTKMSEIELWQGGGTKFPETYVNIR